ncbi:MULTISPECIES: hypothetical protein [Saliphagus]|uniref:Uncharacterized protein n=1 Tax=Saliphagus infecundisoli TaxID=1849069 RepID=A0ABD5QJN3_9EURY|nr:MULTISPECIES: hypothetical protein [Saliphagus]
MEFPDLSPRVRRGLCLGMTSLFVVQAGLALLERGSISWGLIAAFGVVTALLVGPVAWAARDRIPRERRENLGYALAGLAVLSIPLVVGVGLVTGTVGLFYYEGLIGTWIGAVIVVLAEETVVPERLREPAR